MKTMVPAGVLAVFLAAGPSLAATIDFTGVPNQNGGSYTEDGLVFDDLRVIPTVGNCQSASGAKCAAMNRNEVAVLTSIISGGLFTLTSIWYDVQGSKSVLTLTSNLGGLVVLGPTPSPGTFDLTSVAGFANVTSVTFTADTQQNGNVRFDDIGIGSDVAPVPVPAAGGLMLLGLGALAAFRRKRAAA